MTHASPSPSARTEQSSHTAGTAAPAERPLSAGAAAFLAERGLSPRILTLLPVAFGTARGRECLVFGQVVDGVRAGYKARFLAEKEFFQKIGTPQRLWNLDQCQGSERIFITEGELDACALVQAGISAKEVVSIWGGAKGEESANLRQAHDALEQLVGVKSIVLCTDSDSPGRALRACLAKVLGAARCSFVDWPPGIKDANEMLVKCGADALRHLVLTGSVHWPVDGLFRLSELPDPPRLELWDAGFPEWRGGLKLAPTMFSIVCGHGGHGKTAFMAQIWQQVARQNLIRVGVCSMETRAKPHYRRHIRQFFAGKLEANMTPDEIRRADSWIEDHYRFIQHPSDRPDLRWLLDVAETAVVRDGCRAIVVDPCNKLERSRDTRQSETEFISQFIDELMLFAKDLSCHIQITVHPSKTPIGHKGAPELEMAAGSKSWETKCDQGFVVWRPSLFADGEQQTECEFIVRKSRFDELGFPRTFNMRWDLNLGRYVSADHPMGGRHDAA